jgi:hypothetical protein
MHIVMHPEHVSTCATARVALPAQRFYTAEVGSLMPVLLLLLLLLLLLHV